METLAVVGDHRPPSGAAGDSGAARSWLRPLTSRVARSPYYPALSHPVLRRLLPGVALSALGDGMSMVAIAWLALRLSDSAVLVGAALAAYSLPGALGAAVLGRWMQGRGGATLALTNAIVRASALGLIAALALAGALAPVSYVALLGVSSLLSAWGMACPSTSGSTSAARPR